MTDLNQVVSAILAKREEVTGDRGLVACITGIDGCGKGYVTKNIVSVGSNLLLTNSILNVFYLLS